MVEMAPDFLLADVDKAVDGSRQPRPASGCGAVVDAMPCDLGRNVLKLAEISRRSGVHVVAPTGLHSRRTTAEPTGAPRCRSTTIADAFIADIARASTPTTTRRPSIRRTPHRAGVIKVAGGVDRPV